MRVHLSYAQQGTFALKVHQLLNCVRLAIIVLKDHLHPPNVGVVIIVTKGNTNALNVLLVTSAFLVLRSPPFAVKELTALRSQALVLHVQKDTFVSQGPLCQLNAQKANIVQHHKVSAPNVPSGIIVQLDQ